MSTVSLKSLICQQDLVLFASLVLIGYKYQKLKRLKRSIITMSLVDLLQQRP